MGVVYQGLGARARARARAREAKPPMKA